MIKLSPVAKPAELTDLERVRLTKLFETTGEPVWQKEYVRKALLSMSNNKCCYCECNVTQEATYFEVEHFYHKHTYKSKVMEWENLLPSCKRCNGTKNDHDVKERPIINPSTINPKMHLVFTAYRLKGTTNLGAETVIAVDLNNTERACNVRFRLGEQLTNSLETLYELTFDYFTEENTSAQRRNRIVSTFKNLLSECNPKSIYSATLATILLNVNKETYSLVKDMFKAKGLWDLELKEREKEAKKVALRVKA